MSSSNSFFGFETFNEDNAEDTDFKIRKRDKVYNLKQTNSEENVSSSNSSIKKEENKRILLELMKKEELIWDKTHEHHLNISALSAAWKRIAEEMPGMSVSDCKVLWKSLKDALRYRKKVAMKEKSYENNLEDSNDKEENELEQMFSLLAPITSPTKSTLPIKRNIEGEIEKQLNREATIEKPKYDKNKRKLILLVRNEDLIWNKKNKFHYNYAALCSAWDRIAAEMKPLSAIQCKTMWKSVQSSLRYRKKIATKRKFNSTDDEIEELNSKKIKLSTSPNPSTSNFLANASSVITNDKDKNIKPISNNLHNENEGSEIFESLETISKAIGEMVNMAASTRISQAKPCFKYECIWRLIESLYAQMDENGINQVNQKIINLVYDKCKPESG